MKRFLILNIILFLSLTCVSQVYETANGRARNIGYTTNYGYSGFQSTSSTLHATMPNYTGSSRISGMSVRYTNYGNKSNLYSGTYIPGSTSAPGASRPRRITVYNGDGETGQTPGGNKDSSSWLYMQDADGNWYCSKDGGNTWFKWEEKNYGSGWNFDLVSYLWDLAIGNTETWSTTPITPPENSSHWASDPDDPFLDPIGDYPIELLVLLILGYVYYRKRKTVSV